MKFTVTEIDIYLIIREFCSSDISVALLSKSTPFFLYNTKSFALRLKPNLQNIEIGLHLTAYCLTIWFDGISTLIS
jgi:hypothetical protein